ncbi:MAG: TlyA family RNA methyltransferase [Arachnia propionica]|uniref:TlyA family RNA methyltransferase n=1 Tax=Arachnia propionica TaxID=1750 RepID=UPI002705BBA2|nr:TlyA family RNA methyltransferase [Arachnia propionica]
MRLDRELIARGLVSSRTRAARLITAGRVSVAGRVVTKPAAEVGPGEAIQVVTDPWVSRAAHKLLGALDDSGTAVGARVLDAGASTGGFTQVVLSRGAELVHAVDVGHGQLAEEIRIDPRVRVHEGLNLRDLRPSHLGGVVDMVVCDVSFISLRLVLAPILATLHPEGVALLLVKPQFEVGRERLGRDGVVREEGLREQAVAEVVAAAAELGWVCTWRGVSRLPGVGGNIEFFIRLVKVAGR